MLRGDAAALARHEARRREKDFGRGVAVVDYLVCLLRHV
jgi:hypothetical protein